MKKIVYLLLTSLLFIGCKTPPVQKVLPKINQNTVFTATEPKLRLYFPEFYDEKGVAYKGDGTVIILPDNQVIVIDGFVPEAGPQYVEFIKSLNITKIDYIIITHYHKDHIGGLHDVINNFEVGTVFSNGVTIRTELALNLNSLIQQKNINHIVVSQGDHFDFNDDCYADILWPNFTQAEKDDIVYNPGKGEKKINMSSIVTRIQYKDFSIIFPGDLYHEGEMKLVNKYGDKLKSTILKCSHHGEWYTANDFRFVETVAPEYGVIQDNRYITARIASIYRRAAKAPILYRLTPGYMLIESNGKEYSISETSY